MIYPRGFWLLSVATRVSKLTTKSTKVTQGDKVEIRFFLRSPYGSIFFVIFVFSVVKTNPDDPWQNFKCNLQLDAWSEVGNLLL